jgi:hypothetical protein
MNIIIFIASIVFSVAPILWGLANSFNFNNASWNILYTGSQNWSWVILGCSVITFVISLTGGIMSIAGMASA